MVAMQLLTACVTILSKNADMLGYHSSTYFAFTFTYFQGTQQDLICYTNIRRCLIVLVSVYFCESINNQLNICYIFVSTKVLLITVPLVCSRCQSFTGNFNTPLHILIFTMMIIIYMGNPSTSAIYKAFCFHDYLIHTNYQFITLS